MQHSPLRLITLLLCLGIFGLISGRVQQTFSKNIGAPRVSNALQVAAGGDHTCAIQTDGSVKCWGSNSSGQLGLGDTNDRGDDAGEMGAFLPLVDLGTGHTAKQISAGSSHTCAILEDKTLKCWGNDGYWQLGLGDTRNNRGDELDEMGNNLPTINLGTNKTALAVSAGTYHTCAILNDHTLKCWGENNSGQLGYGHTNVLTTPSDSVINLGNGHTALAVSAGIDNTCAILDDATVRCWGDNTYGQLGMGNTTQLTAPSTTAVNLGNHTAIAISASGYHTCAILDDHSARCWGKNNVGQLGLGDTNNRGDATGEMGDNLPVIYLGSGRTAMQIVTSNRGDLDYTCALLNDASIKCWGENGMGQLGQGDTNNRGVTSEEMTNLNAIDLGTGQHVASISIGKAHSCAVLTSTNIKCWGLDSNGRLGMPNWSLNWQLGDYLPQVDLDGVVATPTITSTFTPSETRTTTPTITPTITATYTPSETRTATNTGTATNTRIATNTLTRSLTPSRSRTLTKSRTRTATPIGGIKEVVTVSTGAGHTCVILANDTVKCWGLNNAGQLGLGNTVNIGGNFGDMTNLAKVDLAGHTAKSISAGAHHTCVILEDNTVKC